MACSYTKPTEIPQDCWDKINWIFDTGSNHPIFHGQDPEGNGVESHPIVKSITYYFTVKNDDDEVCFPTQGQIDDWSLFLHTSGVDMDGDCVEEFKEDAVALSVNGGNGVYYAKAYEAGAVDLVLSGG
tara:strand:- start:257 stop:640 length:384 start_codon:yes stop_codon:yes gene_type:complete